MSVGSINMCGPVLTPNMNGGARKGRSSSARIISVGSLTLVPHELLTR